MTDAGYANDLQCHLRGMTHKESTVTDDRLWLALKASQNLVIDSASLSDVTYWYKHETVESRSRSRSFKDHQAGGRVVPLWVKFGRKGWRFLGMYTFLPPTVESHRVTKWGMLSDTNRSRIGIRVTRDLVRL